MGRTIIEKIVSEHSGSRVAPGDVAWIDIDLRTARDFGGASVVKNLKNYFSKPYLDDVDKTFFTFDCNVPAKDIGYAENQKECRNFARETGMRVFDVRAGIGSHILIERGLARPGSILVGTDSHLNIMGAVGCFGQGMGDRDIASIFASGRSWFEVPATMNIELIGKVEYPISAKDITLAVIDRLGSAGALGKVIEFSGGGALDLSLASKITIASMATEMGAIAAFMPVNEKTMRWLEKRAGHDLPAPVVADQNAEYTDRITINLDEVQPLAACPFSPSNVKPISEIEGIPIDTAFLGSCTNGRFEDMVHAASILKGRRVKEGVSLKVVPATQEVFERMMEEGILDILVDSGALVSNPGCGGCASGQIGMIGEGEVQLSTSNRNFAGKQGYGETYLVGPAVAAASVIEGVISSPLKFDISPIKYRPMEEYFDSPQLSYISWVEEKSVSRAGVEEKGKESGIKGSGRQGSEEGCPEIIRGRARLITDDEGKLMNDIDTDMIFHNKYLSITDISEMGEHAFETLRGYEQFSSTVKEGDILIAGENFGCGSSRQQAVDCFISLGMSIILTESTGAIYKRNIINSGFPFLEVPGLDEAGISEGEKLKIDFRKGTIIRENGDILKANPPADVQLDICEAGGLFSYSGE
jgi:3-isopropylmalate/(R)-2-methylmalate dehydratase large subunit